GILEGIHLERQRLSELRGLSHHIVDTSNLTLRELQVEIAALFPNEGKRRFVVHVTSFVFKYVLPLASLLVYYVRFLPNPHYVDGLRPLTGTDGQVRDYVLKWPVTQRFLEKVVDFLEFVLPHFESEGRGLLHVAIGCTGGQHRSVVLAEFLGEHILD